MASFRLFGKRKKKSTYKKQDAILDAAILLRAAEIQSSAKKVDTKTMSESYSKSEIDSKLNELDARFESKLDKVIYEFKAHVDYKFNEIKSDITDLRVELTGLKSEVTTELKWVKNLLLIVIVGIFIPLVAQFWQSNMSQQYMQPVQQVQPLKK